MQHHKQSWSGYHAETRASFAQRLRRLREWARIAECGHSNWQFMKGYGENDGSAQLLE